MSTALATVTTAEAAADPRPKGGDNGVRHGVDSYTPWANRPGGNENTTPGRPRSGPPATSAGNREDPGPCVADGMGGCIGERCADALATGVCDQNGGTAPTITPAELAQRAQNALRLPVPAARTAPPRGSAGLVGLPEWVWVPRSQWHPLTRRAEAGGVWAQVTATPRRLVVDPGDGAEPVACNGPGTAYDPGRAASAQRPGCSHTYHRPSAARPGGVFRVRVRVVWSGTWAGSGGAGGALPDISRSAVFGLRVTEAQSLYR